MDTTVAIDCMGGDHGPGVIVPAALNFQKSHPHSRLVLVGLQEAIDAELRARHAAPGAHLRVHNATQAVGMDEAPALALRGKKDSSMRVAVNLVKSGEAHACVSAGNTGALMAISRFVLKTLPGIDRPAIAGILPTMKGEVYVLDLGANVNCTPEHLLQFAIMGAMLVSAMQHKERPSIGLLNIGEEEIKGNEVVKQAAELLRASDLNFYGNVEGDDIFKGTTDVVVCDGFVGNVALKTAEGLAKMLRTNAPGMYGLKTMMYGTLLPAPVIGRTCLAELKRIVPEVVSRSRSIRRAVVDLPQPDSPTIPSVSPLRTVSVTSSTAWTRERVRLKTPWLTGKCFVTCSSSMIASFAALIRLHRAVLRRLQPRFRACSARRDGSGRGARPEPAAVRAAQSCTVRTGTGTED